MYPSELNVKTVGGWFGWAKKYRDKKQAKAAAAPQNRGPKKRVLAVGSFEPWRGMRVCAVFHGRSYC